MKKLLLLFALLIFACSSDSEGNLCIYEPTLSTEAVTDITETSATLNGIIAIVSENCEVAPGEMQGFVYSTNPTPTNDDNVEVVYGTDISTTIDDLIPNTTYYVRVFITNNLGEFYGNEMEFTTTSETSLVNCDGNPVPTIVYGTQEWTVENACHTTYRDGTTIPQVTDGDEWNNLTTGAWSYYNNDPTKPRLYNWYAVMGIYNAASLSDITLRKEFAPEGWHVPSDDEWATLEEYLIAEGYNFDGSSYSCSPCPQLYNKIAKAISSTTGWLSPGNIAGAVGSDQSLNNSSRFNAFPQAIRYTNGLFNSTEGYSARFWSSTEFTSPIARIRQLYFGADYLLRDLYLKQGGLSVRLVKD
jgi:uncharacterized protein (TIGR02145 family)